MERPALVIVDMQKYYLRPASDFHRFCEHEQTGGMAYIAARAEKIVIPAIRRLLDAFRRARLPIIYLRLCGRDPARKDLHRFFRASHEEGAALGYPDVYPLTGTPMADVIEELAPEPGDIVLDKTTFSGFTSAELKNVLRELNVQTLIMTGLATSQCVETTARDASDRGFTVVQVEDAQADYTETSHHASLYSSAAVCGGEIRDAAGVLNLPFLEKARQSS